MDVFIKFLMIVMLFFSYECFAYERIREAISLFETGNIEKASEILKSVENEGDQFSLYAKCSRFFNGINVEKDIDKALPFCKGAADRGVADAQVVMGYLDEGEYFSDSTEERALQWYELAAKQGNTYGEHSAARLYFKKEEDGYKKGLNYLKKGLDKNHAHSQNLMAISYLKGLGIEKNKEEAFALFTKAEKQGLPEARHNLAIAYCLGRGVRKDKDKGLELFYENINTGFELSKEKINVCRKDGWEILKSFVGL